MSGSKILKSGQNGVFVYAKGVATVNKCEILGSGNVGVIICEGSSAEVLSLSLSLCLPLRLSCLTHIRRKTKTQIVASKTLNLNSTINFDAKQTKLILPNYNLNLASNALKFNLTF